MYHTTTNGIPTQVLLLPATAPAQRHVLFFPGDVQMRRAEMEADLRGGTFEWKQFSLDDSLPALQARFGADAHVWCLRPARMVYQFAAYQQFARVTILGAASEYNGYAGRAGTGITSTFDAAAALAIAAGCIPATDAALPLVLLGFSKGVVPLVQLIAELGAADASALALLARCSELHLVDGGSGTERGAYPAASWSEALDALSAQAARGLRIAVHSTPYMLASVKQPWLAPECAAFVGALEARGVKVDVSDYFMREKPSLERHFGVLAELRC
ncbi:hypothetical protein T492DRAFT_1077458 [Pavlovales sp. CCMP2436]|nr:hypothetical protein T492DRAFT_1077458 [Pavlovales sp. CCMP2436]